MSVAIKQRQPTALERLINLPGHHIHTLEQFVTRWGDSFNAEDLQETRVPFEFGWKIHFRSPRGKECVAEVKQEVDERLETFAARARAEMLKQARKAHAVKCDPEYFRELRTGNKRFEARFNDRDYQEGDLLIVSEFDRSLDKYSGDRLVFDIGFVLYGPAFGIQDGHCVMSVTPAENGGNNGTFYFN